MQYVRKAQPAVTGGQATGGKSEAHQHFEAEPTLVDETDPRITFVRLVDLVADDSELCDGTELCEKGEQDVLVHIFWNLSDKQLHEVSVVIDERVTPFVVPFPCHRKWRRVPTHPSTARCVHFENCTAKKSADFNLPTTYTRNSTLARSVTCSQCPQSGGRGSPRLHWRLGSKPRALFFFSGQSTLSDFPLD